MEHALPPLEAAAQAVSAIDKTELVEIRQTKGPHEMIAQVMECVCMLLGVKADWAGAKTVLADPYLQQKMIDIEKETISEQVISVQYVG